MDSQPSRGAERGVRRKRKKKQRYKGRKERLRTRNEMLARQIKEKEEMNSLLSWRKDQFAKENLLLKK